MVDIRTDIYRERKRERERDWWIYELIFTERERERDWWTFEQTERAQQTDKENERE